MCVLMPLFFVQTFSLARRALKLGGLLLFSTEDLDASPMRRSDRSTPTSTQSESCTEVPNVMEVGVELLSSARYAHSQSYIEAVAVRHGFYVARVEELIIRTEASVPLPGKIFVLQLTDSGS
jgi:predicted TPR repeat methyltransferase